MGGGLSINLMIIKNDELKTLLTEKGAIVEQGRILATKMEALNGQLEKMITEMNGYQDEHNKLQLDLGQLKDKIVPIVKAEVGPLPEYVEIMTCDFNADGEIEATTGSIIDQIKTKSEAAMVMAIQNYKDQYAAQNLTEQKKDSETAPEATPDSAEEGVKEAPEAPTATETPEADPELIPAESDAPAAEIDPIPTPEITPDPDREPTANELAAGPATPEAEAADEAAQAEINADINQ